jgi:hypothetical protein
MHKCSALPSKFSFRLALIKCLLVFRVRTVITCKACALKFQYCQNSPIFVAMIYRQYLETITGTIFNGSQSPHMQVLYASVTSWASKILVGSKLLKFSYCICTPFDHLLFRMRGKSSVLFIYFQR